MENEKSVKAAFYTKVVKSEENSLVSVELAVPIKLSGTVDEIYRLSELVNKTAKSELGKETLEMFHHVIYYTEWGIS